MLGRASADAIPIWTRHASAKFMQDCERCPVAEEPQLPLKLHGGDAPCLIWRSDRLPWTRHSRARGCSPLPFAPSVPRLSGTFCNGERPDGLQAKCRNSICRALGRQPDRHVMIFNYLAQQRDNSSVQEHPR
jgi:hypothetical protein